ncbi:SusC/RagA family TonB-linked outer membrane protein [Myroides sp. M-43]|uniref:SusC/RagA family TonB-linked outer membrane protein n=1 Tax=Myroides oncorhynchi TaxID=2893756 RepID=UPI001E34CE3A|nr:SusC/RagA family TonB-linked outer membrane protein [Myroides oncorhynchi]MCC9043583.1 SusC/RagA family TonB-linked outer membrane protein [Myroides oncorhynchi]
MKTQFLTKSGYRIALILSLSLTYPTYAVYKDDLMVFDYQDKTISGVVKDKDGVLIGAIIQIKNSDFATTTDQDGKFILQVSKQDIIVISYIGYTSKEISVAKQNTFDIVLDQNQDMLSEIVLNAGYYSVKDRERTGSISRVTAKDIEIQPVSNPLQALQGKMAGVNITQQTGVPGGGMHIEIRGRNFLGTNKTNRNNPLYIINGVPFISTPLGMDSRNLSSGILQEGISPLNAINPKDIESIEVLKDADATAIYGSRGANGVVLITTKKGKTDKTNFTFTSTTAFSKVAKFLNMMDTKQYLQMREEAFVNSGITDLPINAFDLNGAWDRNRYTNWQKELIGDTAIDKNISLGVSAGNEYSSFTTNYLHNNSTTVFPTDKGYKRNSLLFNYNYRSKDNKLQFNASTSYSYQSNNLPNVDFTSNSLTLAPNAPSLRQENGDLNWQNGTFYNPLAQLEVTYENKIETLILNSTLSYNLLPNTYLKLNTGFTTNNLNEWLLTPHTANDPQLGLTSEVSEASNSKNNFKSFIIEPQVNYLKTWNNHSLNILVGSTFQSNQNNQEALFGRNFNTNSSIKNLSAAKERFISLVSNTQYKYASLFTRLNYTYNNKYIANITARRDGSSRFGKENRFGNFGAIGTAWLFSKEKLLANLKWLDFGKLRMSYGVTGSDNIGDYAYLDTYTTSTTKYNDEIGLYPTALYNPNYKWEKTTKFEAAIELELFKSRINPTIAYYNNTSTDQLIGLTLPSTTGFNLINSNSPATIRNTGWEFTINTTNFSNKDWMWSTNFNISFPKNKLISYPGLDKSTMTSNYIIGKSINIVKTYQYQGVDPDTGYYLFNDYNQDGKIDIADKQSVNDLNPKMYGGLQNSIAYKNISLDFLFYFKIQNNYNLNRLYSIPGAYMTNIPQEMDNRWSVSNPNAKYSFSSYDDTTAFNQSMIFLESDSTISNASYIKLKNLSVSYNLKIPKAKIESLRLYIQGQNLWTITSYKGMDPEFTSFGFLPPLKTYAFGMQLTF